MLFVEKEFALFDELELLNQFVYRSQSQSSETQNQQKPRNEFYQIWTPFYMDSQLKKLSNDAEKMTNTRKRRRKAHHSMEERSDGRDFLLSNCRIVQNLFTKFQNSYKGFMEFDANVPSNNEIARNCVKMAPVFCPFVPSIANDFSKKCPLKTVHLSQLNESPFVSSNGDSDERDNSKTILCSNPQKHTITHDQWVFPPNSLFLLADVSLIRHFLSHPNEKFELIVADPPWPNRTVKRQRTYQMFKAGRFSLDNLFDRLGHLPIPQLLADDGLFCIWLTNSKTAHEMAQELLEKWELRRLAQWHWLKICRTGEPICAFRPEHKVPFESLLIACKKCSANEWKIPDNFCVISVPNANPSRKPPISLLLQQLGFVGQVRNGLELFARYLLPNFTSVGLLLIRLHSFCVPFVLCFASMVFRFVFCHCLKGVHRNTRNVLQLGIGFFFIFLAFNSQGFIEESVLESFSPETVPKHAGYTSLCIIYASFTVLNFAAPPIVQCLGTRTSLALAGSTYVLFLSGFLFVNTFFLYFSSALLGLGAAVIWTAQGKYLALNSSEQTAGKHSSLFLALSLACLSFGGFFLLIIFLVNDDTASLSSSSSSSPSLNNSSSSSSADISPSFDHPTIKLVYGSFTGIALLGVAVLALLPPTRTNSKVSYVNDNDGIGVEELEMKKSEEERRKKQQDDMNDQPRREESSLERIMVLAASRKMAALAVVFGYTGILLSFWSSIFPTALINTLQMRSQFSPKILIALNAIFKGLGQPFLSVLFECFRLHRVKRSRLVFVGMLLHLLAFVLIFLILPNESPLGPTDKTAIIRPNVVIALFCGFLLSFGDAFWSTQIFAFLITNYPNRSAESFALFKFYQSLLTSKFLLPVLSSSAPLASSDFVHFRYLWLFLFCCRRKNGRATKKQRNNGAKININ
ncbi:hypothetical protein niasHS_015050 [Heterodera schachtii]|uniref:UNC93-like protein MFSD11 n=1 Tax=Heterodera schachtii TaxID=97005 RepID=A0ABD2IAG4_HETSC